MRLTLQRLLLALLLPTQLALPLAAALGDEPPTRAAHVAHVSGDAEDGCHVHDPADCVHCRLLSALVLLAPARADALAAGHEVDALVPRSPALRGACTRSVHRPRAPPTL